MFTAYQYRVYPTYKQRQTFEKQLEACQTVYNQALAMRKEAFEQKGEAPTYNKQAGMLTQLRRKSVFWTSAHIDLLQDTLRRLDKAYKAFFRRVNNGLKPGFPRFKGKGRCRSMTYSHLSVKLLREIKGRLACLVVPKVGQVLIQLHRPLPDGRIKTLTIQRKASGWYASICVEVDDVPKVEIQSVVGVDVGLQSFLTTSDGEKAENPRHLRRAEKKLKRKQCRVSKRNKGSNRRKKLVHELALQHERVVNQRKDFHGKTAHQLYSRYNAVVVEDLQIRNMVKNHHLAKSISDAAWGNFILTLGTCAKAENAGLHLLKVPPHGTSQICSSCGEKVKKSLAVRVHRCDSCGLVLDRDHNAAINILQRCARSVLPPVGAAVALRGGAVVTNTPEKLSLERRKREIRKTYEDVLLQAPSFRAG